MPSLYSRATLLNAVPPLKTTRAGALGFSDTSDLNTESLEVATCMGEPLGFDAEWCRLEILGI